VFYKFITAFCWCLGPIGTSAIIYLWCTGEHVKGSTLFLVFLCDLWLVVRYFG